VSMLLSLRKADILVVVAYYVAAKGRLFDKKKIAEAWRRAPEQSFVELSILAGMKPQPILRGVFQDELDKRAEESC
jgi:hypothetical protein